MPFWLLVFGLAVRGERGNSRQDKNKREVRLDNEKLVGQMAAEVIPFLWWGILGIVAMVPKVTSETSDSYMVSPAHDFY